MADSSSAPPAKKKRLSLSRKKKTQYDVGRGSRFCLSTDRDVEEASKGVVPANTERANSWALNNFEAWVSNRNAVEPKDPVPVDLLSSNDPETVCKWMQKFVMETRQESGEPYPPKSLHGILCGIYRVCRSKGMTLNFMDKKDARFAVLHNTLDSVVSSLHSQGVGASTSSASVITIDDEETLLNKEILSMDNPTSLQRMVFFYVGLHCCLRGGQEQRNLVVSQFTRFPPDTAQYTKDTFYQYTEYISKNNQHRFKDIHSKNKSVKVYALVGSRKCLVKILDFYLKKLPPEPKAFYLRPLTKVPDDPEKPWFANVPVGVNTLRTMLGNISEKGELATKYTNHSLRATSASRLFACNVPEKIIQEKTGHRSLAGLRSYEHTTKRQEQDITKLLESPSIDFKENVAPESPNIPKETESSQLTAVVRIDHKEKSSNAAPVFSGQLQNCIFNFYSS